MSEDYSKNLSKDVKVNDNLLLDNIHLRLCIVEKNQDEQNKKLAEIEKKTKNKWLSLLETIIIATALIVTAILGLI